LINPGAWLLVWRHRGAEGVLSLRRGGACLALMVVPPPPPLAALTAYRLDDSVAVMRRIPALCQSTMVVAAP